MTFEQWASLLTQGGWVIGAFAIIFGYLKGYWISGVQHQKDLAEKDKQLDQLRAELGTDKTECEARIAQVRADHAEVIRVLRTERDEAIARARQREEKWEQIALTATGLIEKMNQVTGRAVNLAGLKQEGGDGG